MSSMGQVTAVKQAMHGRSFVMNVKLDGERMSCHMQKDQNGAVIKIKMFTRRGTDYSAKYQPLEQDIANSVAAGFSCVFILDGEVCAYDSEIK